MEKTDIEIKWTENVTKAKDICAVKETNQMEVARLALEVCEISWGGSNFAGKYTLQRFADEVGCSSRVLSTWVCVRRSVFDKIPEVERAGVSYTKLALVACRVAVDASPKHVRRKFREMTNRDQFQDKMIRHLASVRSAAYNFERADAADKCSKKMLQEYLFYCRAISNKILGNNRGMKAADNGLAGKGSFIVMSANKALGTLRPPGKGTIKVKDPMGHGEISLTPKDRDIANLLRKTPDKFFSPTEIGVELKGHNRSSASAWACRTLNKLLALEHVERNKLGKYKWSANE